VAPGSPIAPWLAARSPCRCPCKACPPQDGQRKRGSAAREPASAGITAGPAAGGALCAALRMLRGSVQGLWFKPLQQPSHYGVGFDRGLKEGWVDASEKTGASGQARAASRPEGRRHLAQRRLVARPLLVVGGHHHQQGEVALFWGEGGGGWGQTRAGSHGAVSGRPAAPRLARQRAAPHQASRPGPGPGRALTVQLDTVWGPLVPYAALIS
jgi:hypothetical protein